MERFSTGFVQQFEGLNVLKYYETDF
jgi:hypothetical protein